MRGRGLASLVFFVLAGHAVAGAQTLPPPSPEATGAASATPGLPTPGVSAPTPAPAPLALAKTKLQLNPGASSAVSISGGVPPYRVAFGSAPAAVPLPPVEAPLESPLPAPPDSAAAAAPAGEPAVSALATLAIDPVASTLIVRAQSPVRGQAPPAGTTAFTIADAAGATVTGSLLVGSNAAFLPTSVRVDLVGNPSQEFATVQIGAAIRRAARPLPGAGVVVAQVTIPQPLPAGETLELPVKIHADGVGRYVDVDGFTNVRLATATAPPVVPATLFYSDDPENVKADGILFRGTVTAGRAARLYYYHQALVPGRQVAVVLDAPAGSAQVTVVGHGAGPNPAVMFVGQGATYRFLDDRARGAGVSLDIPVGAPVVIGAGDSALGARDLVAGALDIGVAGGDPVRVTVMAYTPGVDPQTLLGGVELPSDGYRRRGEYDLAQTLPIVLAERLPVAPPPLAVASPSAPATPSAEPSPSAQPPLEPTQLIGTAASALPNLRAGGRALGGDYGLVHPLRLTLGNDSEAPAALYLYEQPVTGYPVTTTIQFDGDAAPLRLQCVKTKTSRYLVRAFTIPPHATMVVTGSYMTDGGSTYPLLFGLSATQPSPPPLTMTEADGCYPKPAAAGSPTPVATPAT